MLSELIGDQSHFIPSYTGHCPQAKFTVGERYAAVTHRTITDPRYAHIYARNWHRKNVASIGKSGNDFNEIIEKVNERAYRNSDAIYRHPMVSTYSGHLPRRSTNDVQQLGQRFTLAATQGIRDFYNDVTVGKKNIPAMIKPMHQTIQSNFKSSDENAYYKLGHTGHHPLQYNYFGRTNMVVTTECRRAFQQICLMDKIERWSPITTKVSTIKSWNHLL